MPRKVIGTCNRMPPQSFCFTLNFDVCDMLMTIYELRTTNIRLKSEIPNTFIIFLLFPVNNIHQVIKHTVVGAWHWLDLVKYDLVFYFLHCLFPVFCKNRCFHLFSEQFKIYRKIFHCFLWFSYRFLHFKKPLWGLAGQTF